MSASQTFATAAAAASQGGAAGANPAQTEDINRAVTRIFSDLKRDMDAIVSSSDLAAGGGPLLRLGHGRTESEAPGYDDYELPHPLGQLPEALAPYDGSTAAASGPESPARYSSTAAQATALLASTVEAAEQLVSSVRSSDSAASESLAGPDPSLGTRLQQRQERHRGYDRADLLYKAPAMRSTGVRGGSDSVVTSGGGSETYSQQQGGASRQLSYKELLDRALAWNPRVKGAAGAGHNSSSMPMSSEMSMPRRSSASSFSAGGPNGSSSRRPRPSSTGRMPSAGRISGGGLHSPPDYRVARQYQQQDRSKFPLATTQHSSHFSLSEQRRGQVSSSSRIFSDTADAYPQGPGSRRTSRAVLDRSPPTAKQGPYRSRSAPREEAAARRHIERMNASPNRATAAAVAASRESILAGQQQQALPSWQREQAIRQSGGNLRGSAGFSSPSAKKSAAWSPDAQRPMRMTDDEWNRVSSRLQQYVPGGKPGAAGMQSARTSSTHNNRRSSSTSPGRFDRLSASAAAVPLAPDFYRRQDALLQRRAELAAKRRASDEDDLNECTFRPHINPSSRNLQRSVTQLHAWEARRRLTVFAKALDKTEHECEGYTFTPSINPLSRQLALANYAVAPDPARPWTLEPTSPDASNPKARDPSPEAVRILRGSLPPAGVIMRAGPTAQQKAEAVMDLLGGPCAATAASTRHYERSSVSPEAPIEGAAGHAPWKGSKLAAAAAAAAAAARASASTVHEDEEEEEEEGEDLAHSQRRERRTGPGARGVDVVASVGTDGGSSSASRGPSCDGVSVVGGGDGTIVIRITSSSSSQQADKAAGPLAEQAAAPASARPKGVVQQQQADGALAEPQLLLAALKLSPGQAQQGLEEGRSRCSAGGTGCTQYPAAAAAAARGSSSGGMAPGTPGGGSLGGLGSGGGKNSAAPFNNNKPGLSGPAGRDDSAGGMHAASIAKRLSVGGSPGAAAAAAHKPWTGSPLSRSQQQQQQQQVSPKAYTKDSYTKDSSLQDLAQQLGFPVDRAAAEQFVHAAGLNTVPAYFVSAAEHRAPPPAAVEAAKRPSSYSQRYQMRLSNSAGSDTKQGPQADAGGSPTGLSPELLDLMSSLGVDGSSSPTKGGGRRGSSSAGGSPTGAAATFAQLKARWQAKESACPRETSAAGGQQQQSGPGGGSLTHRGTAGGQHGSVGGSLEAGPETPMHQQQQQHNPFTTPAGLPKQYSTAQVLNARVRHTSSSGGGMGPSSSIGGAYDAAADSLAAATAALLHGPGQAAAAAARRGSSSGAGTAPGQQQQHTSVTVSAAAVSVPPGLDLGSVALTAVPTGCSAAAADSQVVVLLTNGSSNGAYPLAACSSVISVPDASGYYGTAVAASMDSCNGSSRLQALVTEKVEGLLEGTRSVPFELVLSPRSKFLIASTAPRGSSAGGGGGASAAAPAAAQQPMAIDVASPLGQHLLQLLMETGRVSENGSGASGIPTTALTLSLAQWQWLQQQYQQQQEEGEGEEEQGPMHVPTSPPQPPQAAAAPPAAAPAAAATAETAVGLPSTQSSSVADAVAQLLGATDCSAGECAFTTPAAAVAAVATACEAALPAALAAACGGRSAAASPDDACRPGSSSRLASPEQQLVVTAFARSSDGGSSSSIVGGSADSSQTTPQQQQQAPDGGDLAAELAALLQSAGSMSPEEKADAVARTFAKTISRLNMSSSVLSQTIAALDPSAAPTQSPQHRSTSRSWSPTEAAAATAVVPVVASPESPPAAAATRQEAGLSDLDMADMSHAESMQQLLERVSAKGMMISPQSSLPQRSTQQQQQQLASTDCSTPAHAGKSWAAVAAATPSGRSNS